MNTLVENDFHIINLDAYRARLSDGPLPGNNLGQWDELATLLAGHPAHFRLIRPAPVRTCHLQRRTAWWQPRGNRPSCRTAMMEANLERLVDELETEVNRLLGRNDEVLSLVARD
jgi:hypothetical protein